MDPANKENINNLNKESVTEEKATRPVNNFRFEETVQPSSTQKSPKALIIIIGIIAIVLILGFIFRTQIKGLFFLSDQTTSTPTPIPTSAPTPSPKPALIRSDWSFEVLNGSGITGLAKKVADQINSLGYQVVKTGNADKNDYPNTQIMVREELADKLDLIIADLKDIVKIASSGGQLKDSTSSARLILGKDLPN